MLLNIKEIELAGISRYRNELMGAAIVFVIFFHVTLPRTDMFYGLCRMGNIGVDMFLFLSGVGLWFSWYKTPSARRFFIRRYLRVYPTWTVMACLFYIPDFLGGQRYSKSVTDLLGDIVVNWDFWLNDELTFWYIPATMMLYVFTPAYMELIRRNPVYRWLPVMMVMWCVIVQWVAPVHDAVGHIEIFWSRVPVYFIGINMGEAVRRKDTLPANSVWLIVLMFAMSLSACIYLEQELHGKFPLFIERMLYIPLTVTGILLLCRVFSHAPRWTGRIFMFLGSLSLEIYLIHAHFVLDHIWKYKLGFWLTFLLCTAIAIPLAWLLNKLIALAVKPIEKRLK